MSYGYTRCILCGHIFEKRQPAQKVCTLWKTNKSRDACHLYWARLYYLKRHIKRKAEARPIVKLDKRQQVKLKSGCIVVPAFNKRCSQYVDCQYNNRCLMQLPASWKGFEAINNCGFKRRELGTSTDEQNSVFWGYHQVLSEI